MAVIRINEIIDRLISYHSQADIGLVQKAYVWSAKLHAGSLRKSGLPYLSHPLEVAGVLTELELHESSIAAGLLHDVLEDSSITLEELEGEFGKEIGRLVDGVTKIGRIPTNESRIEVQAENFRKIILAMAQDVRVILIKLADRLHNMQTLEFLEEEKRLRIAKETIEIYAPIAGRLGIHWIQAQLEDLSFRHLKPELFFRLAAQMARDKEARQEYIENMQTTLTDKLSEAGIQAKVTGRFKHLHSVYAKMERQKLSFDEVHDLIAFRIIVDTLPLCYDALRVIHSEWSPVPGRIKDYIALSKSNMYQSLHTTLIGSEGERVEIQIRTPEMHAVAEYGIAAHWRYKEGGVPASPETEKKTLQFLDHLVEYHQELKDPYHFLESVKSEIVPDVIVVFTPQGDIIELPAGATPIDLAYAIHSDIGNRCAGAKVNGRLVPLNHTLKSGDTIEILTSNTVEPQKAWLEIVKTPRAKAKINHWIATKELSRVRELGRQIVEAELLRHRKALGKLIESGEMGKVAQHYHFSSVNRLFEAVGNNAFPVRKVTIQMVPPEELQSPSGAKPAAKDKKKSKAKTKTKAPRKSKKTKTAAPEPETAEAAPPAEQPMVTVTSFNDPLVRFGECCQPLVGEDIDAIRLPESILEIHRADCPRVLEQPSDQTLPARWAPQVEGETKVTIQVISEDRKGLLTKLSALISDANLNIVRAVVHTTDDKKAIHTFKLAIKHAGDLKRVIKGMEKIDAVISARRA